MLSYLLSDLSKANEWRMTQLCTPIFCNAVTAPLYIKDWINQSQWLSPQKKIHISLSKWLQNNMNLFCDLLWLAQHAYVCVLSCVCLFATPWNIAHQAPLSTGFSRQEHWSGLPFLSPGDLPNQGTEPASPVLVGGFRFFTTTPRGKPSPPPNKKCTEAFSPQRKPYLKATTWPCSQHWADGSKPKTRCYYIHKEHR